MSSGHRSIIINSLERALGNDVNRLQDFRDRGLQQVLRRWLLDTVYTLGNNTLTANVTQSQGGGSSPASAGSPLLAAICNGLMVEVFTGDLTVTAGTLVAIDDSIGSGADDSPCVFVDSPGQPTLGVLTPTANAGPGVRVDVVEVEIASFVTETQTRDVFNEVTQTFTPTVVDKVREAQLNFRIRLGTQGAGYPGHASGWLPLAVVIAPSGASDFAAMTFYDVRPLVSDRHTGGPVVSSSMARPGLDIQGYGLISSGVLSGTIEAAGNPASGSAFGPYWIGGRMRESTPTATDNDSIDFTAAVNRTLGYTPGNNEIVCIAAFFPLGLPRWVRYAKLAATTGGSRLPWGPRGIVLATDATNVVANGFVSRDFPAELGLAGPAHPGRVLAATMTDGGAAMRPTAINGSWNYFDNSTKFVASDVETDAQQRYPFVTNTDVPRCAKKFRGIIRSVHTGATAVVSNPKTYDAQVQQNAVNRAWLLDETVSENETGRIDFRAVVEGPLAQALPFDPTSTRVLVNSSVTGGTIDTGDSSFRVVGWQL